MLCTVAKWGCTGAKQASDGTKDSWETLVPADPRGKNLFYFEQIWAVKTF